MKTQEELKRACGKFCANNKINPNTVTGAKLIFSWWSGAYEAQGERLPPGVGILMVCGRACDLVVMPPKEETK